MCMIDLEPADVWDETERKARKRHTCSCCLGAIEPGQKYVVHFSVFDHRPTSEKMCLACRDDRKTFADAHDGVLCTPGHFPAMLKECIADNDPDDERWKPMLKRICATGIK